MELDYFALRAMAGRLATRLAGVLCALGIAAGMARAAEFQPLDLPGPDLAGVTNALVEPGGGGLPPGPRTFGGIPFKISSRLQVTGMEQARRGEFHPARTALLPIVAKGAAARIHLLHGVEQHDKDGVPVASLVLHYANGEERSLRILYGTHVRAAGSSRRDSRKPLLDPGSSLAWNSSRDGAGAPGDAVSLYQTVFENPRPDLELQSIELVSLFSRATPFLAGITLELGPGRGPAGEKPSPARSRRALKRAQGLKDSAYHGELRIRAQDQDGARALTNAVAALSISDGDAFFHFGEAGADRGGVVRLPFPPQQTLSFQALVRAPGHQPAVISGSITNGQGWPAEFVVKLSPGTKIGGMVVEGGGQPVAGARVLVRQVRPTGPREYLLIDVDDVRADAKGGWTSSAVAPDASGLQFEVVQPGYPPSVFQQEEEPATGGGGGNAVRRSDLLAGRATLKLPRLVRAQVKVTGMSGQPLARAEVRLLEPGRAAVQRVLTANNEGVVSLTIPEPGIIEVMIVADGYAPQFRVVNSGATQAIVPVALARPQPMKGQVVNQANRPVPGARLRLESWEGSGLFRSQTEADDQGRFIWETLPEGNLVVSVSAPSHRTIRTGVDHSARNGATEQRFMISLIPHVAGRVTDAETGQPIGEFAVVKGRAYGPTEPMRWERYDTVTGRVGQYDIRLEEYQGMRWQLMVEAPGYLPATSPIIETPGVYTNDFALKRGRGVGGVVALQDGTVVSNAMLALVERSNGVYMDRPGELRRSGSGGEFQRSRGDGRFEFPPRLEADRVIATHPLGFAEVRMTNLIATGRVILQPWGRVKGVLKVGPRILPGQSLSLQNASQYNEDGRSYPALSIGMKADPDPDGNFVFEKVPPGERKVYLQFRLGDIDQGRTATSHGKSVTVPPNQTAEVIIGGSGRAVIGRVTVTGGDPEDVDWRRDMHTLNSQLALPPELAGPTMVPNMTEADQRKAWMEFSRRQSQFWQSEPGRKLEATRRNYALVFDTNGVFRAESVEAGKYTLFLNVTRSDNGDNSWENIGSLNQEVTVPAAPRGKPDEPFDLGTFQLPIRGTVREGRRAPLFEAKTFEGKAVRLQDFRGKYVLLDFWATWAGQRSADVEALKALHETYRKGDQLVLLGLNFDQNPKDATDAIQKSGLAWTQCAIGEWGRTTLHAQFGVQGLPEAVLIDPQGKLAARSLRGPNIRAVVSRLVPKADVAQPKP